MNTYKYFILTYIFLTISISKVSGQTTYYTYLNDFRGFKTENNYIENNLLCEKNLTNSNIYTISDFEINSSNFSIYANIANINNEEGKTVKVLDENGKKHKIHNTVWGLVWNYKDENNFHLIEIQCHNKSLHDVTDQRYMTITAKLHQNGKECFLKKDNLSKNIDLDKGFNIIHIKNENNITTVSIGKKKPIKIFELAINYEDSFKIGYFSGPGASVALERYVHKVDNSLNSTINNTYSKETVDNYLSSTNLNLIEGKWQYLDRNIDEETLKLGGKYTIAIVKNNQNGYDIVYYDGAKVNASNWKCGMIKGRLEKTSFQDNYNLIWWDSKNEIIDDDTYATITDFKILTLYFPTYKAQMRFVKL